MTRECSTVLQGAEVKFLVYLPCEKPEKNIGLFRELQYPATSTAMLEFSTSGYYDC